MRIVLACRLAVLALVLLLTGSGLVSAAAPPKLLTDAQLGFYGSSRTELLEHVKRLAIMPVYMPKGFEAREDVKSMYEEKVSDYLRKAGFEVVGRQSFQAIYDRLSRQVGDLYDPNSGAPHMDKLTAAYEAARRELIEKEHLDGYVLIRIVSAKANFTRDYVVWDGVVERSDGQFVTSFLGRMWNEGNSKGTLLGYSLLLQFCNPGDKIVYGRAGGIQLGMYYKVAGNKAASDFNAVPRDNLFKDEKRAERAVRLATYPLLFSAEQIALAEQKHDTAADPYTIKPADLPPPPSADPSPPAPALKVPREQLLGSIHRVAVTRLLSGAGISVSPEIADRYMDLLRAELKGLGWELVETKDAPGLLGQEVVAGGGLYDPSTGQLRLDRLAAIRKAIFPKLGLKPPPDAMLWVQLQRRSVTHRFGDVQWDGVGQSAVDMGPIRPGFFGSRSVDAGDSSIQALSLYVQLRDAADVQLYEARGGIQVLQQLQGDKLTTLAPAEVFHDPARDALAVQAAVHELVGEPAPPIQK